MLDVTADQLDRPFHGLNVLISGGTTGIGRAIALRLMAAGAHVFVFGRHQRELDDTLAEAKDGAHEFFVEMDGRVHTTGRGLYTVAA